MGAEGSWSWRCRGEVPAFGDGGQEVRWRRGVSQRESPVNSQNSNSASPSPIRTSKHQPSTGPPTHFRRSRISDSPHHELTGPLKGVYELDSLHLVAGHTQSREGHRQCGGSFIRLWDFCWRCRTGSPVRSFCLLPPEDVGRRRRAFRHVIQVRATCPFPFLGQENLIHPQHYTTPLHPPPT